jgi:hypothetical protein
MNKAQRNLLAQAYQSAWYAYSGQPIAVSVDEKGLFYVRHEKANVWLLPEWSRKMKAVDLLVSLSHITENLALKREEQGSLTFTRV